MVTLVLEDAVDEVADGVGCILHRVLGGVLCIFLRLLGSGSSLLGSLLGCGGSLLSSLLGCSGSLLSGLFGGSGSLLGGLFGGSGSLLSRLFGCVHRAFAGFASSVNLAADGSTNSIRGVVGRVDDGASVFGELTARLFQASLHFTSGPIRGVHRTVAIFVGRIDHAADHSFGLLTTGVNLASDFVGYLATSCYGLVDLAFDEFSAGLARSVGGADRIVDRLLGGTTTLANVVGQKLGSSSSRAAIRIRARLTIFDRVDQSFGGVAGVVDDVLSAHSTSGTGLAAVLQLRRLLASEH